MNRKIALNWNKFLILFLTCTLLFAGVETSSAHGYIVRAIPGDGTVLAHAPTHVQYWFSEALEPDFSRLSVRAPSGDTVATGGVAADDQRLISARLPSGLPNGAYIVELRLAFASDGHVITETQVFFVGDAVVGVAGQRASDAAVPLEVVWRALVLCSLLLLFGTYTLYTLIILPAWGNTAYPAGMLPPRVMRRLNLIVTIALAGAFAGNSLALLQQTMVFYGVDAGTAISNGFIGIVRTSTRFGDVWNARMISLIIVAGCHSASLYFRKSQPQNVRAFWVANTWLMGLVLGTLSITSHAAGSLLWTWLAVANDWLHTVAVGFWVGSIAALVLVIPAALKPYARDDRRIALLAALRRLSRIATICVFLVITTGVYSALNWLYVLSDLVATSYGTALMLKLILVGLLVLLGWAHHITLRPERFRRWVWVIERVGTFGTTLRLEVLITAAVLGSVGLLSATPVPRPEFLNTQAEAPSETLTITGLSVTQNISPGGPGINTYETLLLRDNQPIDDAVVRLQMSNPERDWHGEWHEVESAGDGLYVTTGDEINEVGTWWTLVDITATNGTITRAAFNWTISQETAVPTSREPTILHGLSIASIIGVLLWAAYPNLKRIYQALDLSPVMVVIALLSTAAIIILSAIGFVAIRDSQQRTELLLNPPPQIVNTVLPDEASLERGAALYTSACSEWVTADLQAIRREMPRMRDEALYNALAVGWRGLPACAGLSDLQRWDIVNYLRTWER